LRSQYHLRAGALYSGGQRCARLDDVEVTIAVPEREFVWCPFPVEITQEGPPQITGRARLARIERPGLAGEFSARMIGDGMALGLFRCVSLTTAPRAALADYRIDDFVFTAFGDPLGELHPLHPFTTNAAADEELPGRYGNAYTRGLALLRRLLDASQRADYDRTGAFGVRTRSGRRYRLGSGRIEAIAAGEVHGSYCIGPAEPLVAPDKLIAQLLMLRTDEWALHRIALSTYQPHLGPLFTHAPPQR
jgi:hypothetical protein